MHIIQNISLTIVALVFMLYVLRPLVLRAVNTINNRTAPYGMATVIKRLRIIVPRYETAPIIDIIKEIYDVDDINALDLCELLGVNPDERC